MWRKCMSKILRFGKLCKLGFCMSLFALSTLSFNAPSDINNCHPSDKHLNALELGIKLETHFWKLVQQQKINQFSDELAHIFQGLNIEGIYTRKQQINGLTGATLASFNINNPVAKREGDLLVFSYNFVAHESDLTNGPSLTVWKRYKNSWKIVSHSYVPFQIGE